MIFENIAKSALSRRGAGRFIAFGAMESGKTTIAKHTLDYAIDEIVYQRGGNVFVIDPHAPKTVWGDEITVIGAGMDYKGIREFLDYMKHDVKQRYVAGCGDDSQPLPDPFKPNFIVCEEWTGVISELQSRKEWNGDDNRTFYMDARKAGWGYFLVAHEYTVGALGLKGMGNLLSGVEHFITLEKNAITRQYSATIGNSFKDKTPYDLITPGAYAGRMVYSPAQADSERRKTHKYKLLAAPVAPPPAVVEAPAPDADETRIIDAVEQVRTAHGKVVFAKVTTALGWVTSGSNNQRIKAVLNKWEISY